MAIPTMPGIEETLDALLQQQLISPSFRVYDRIKRQTLSVPGTKAVYKAIKDVIIGGLRASKQGDLDGFIDFCQERFSVQKSVFDEKLATLPRDDATVDERLKFIMIMSAVRDYWQDLAYESVLADIGRNLHGRGHDITRDQLNKILSDNFGPAFSLMVNLYVIRLWGQLTSTPVKVRAPRLKILNVLIASVIKTLDGKDP